MDSRTPPRVAIVTGGGRGIGAAVAAVLGRRGLHVVVNFHSNQQAADAVVEEIEKAGGSADAVRADVTDADAARRLVTGTLARFGSVDVLVCAANIGGVSTKSIDDLAWDDFKNKIIDELASVYHVTQALCGTLSDARAGNIVYISSTAADFVGAGRLSHGVAKAALTTFSGHVAAHLAPRGVTLTTIAPGVVCTDATRDLLSSDLADDLALSSSLGRVTEPDDVAELVALAVEPAMRLAPGTLLRADGGRRLTIGGPTAFG